jgi:hypothetical protein
MVRNSKYIFIFIIVLFSCAKQKTIKKIYYPNGQIASMKIYSDKEDTLNFEVKNFFETGELLSNWEYVNGLREGGFRVFTPLGKIVEQGTYEKGKQEGVYLEYDTTGVLTSESYYINGKRTLYSKAWTSKNRQMFGFDYYYVKNDTTFNYGQIARDDSSGIIIKNLSWNSLILADDTVENSSYSFELITVFPIHCSQYEITFGIPDSNLLFTKVDTNFVTTDSLVKTCRLKLKPGMNHIFGRVKASSEYDAIFFVFKDIYLK